MLSYTMIIMLSLGQVSAGVSLNSQIQMSLALMENVQLIDVPVVKTISSMNVSARAATLVGLLEKDGYSQGDESCDWCFLYWIDGTSACSAAKTYWQAGITEGQKFSLTISDLEPDTAYLFCSKARNSAGEVRGDILGFKTLPDPNAPPVAFDSNEPNMLLIQNFVNVLQTVLNVPHKGQGLLTYVEKKGNLNGIDVNDVFYIEPASSSSKIVSLIKQDNLPIESALFYELAKDAKPENAAESLLELSIYSPEPDNFDISSENAIRFWLPENAFKGKTMTIQQISFDPDIQYPVWDIRNIIDKNNGRTPLHYIVTDTNLAPADPNIPVKIIQPNVPYAWFTLSTSREIADIDGNGIINLNDRAIIAADMGKDGIFKSDIASLINDEIVLGIPDGKVNETDDGAFIDKYNKKNPNNLIPNPYAFPEGFESGQIQYPFNTAGNSPWSISNDSYEGKYCVKSGDIDDNNTSTLEAIVNVQSGKMSFWLKVSSESDFDNLAFYIDGIEKGRWSGERQWRKVNSQITPGTHTFKWIYQKDESISQGEDAAYIDDVNLF
jgi:hypothetical protein